MKNVKNIIMIIFLITLISLHIINCHLTRAYTYDEFKEYNKGKGKVVEVSAGSVEPLANEVYQFASNAGYICRDNGRHISEGLDFFYDQTLDVYDYNNNDTNLVSGKFLRFIYNSINISRSSDSGGLGLIPVAKNLSTQDFINSSGPPSNQIYIDPVSCKFIMPRPFYWSRCESMVNLENGDIGSADVEFSFNQFDRFAVNNLYLSIFSDFKFNNGISLTNTSDSDSFIQLRISPILNEITDKGAVSFWMHNSASFEGYSFPSKTKFICYFGDDDWINLEFTYNIESYDENYNLSLLINLYVYINNVVSGSYSISEGSHNFFNNIKFIGISYNESQGVKVYIDGKPVIIHNEYFASSIVPYIVFIVEKPNTSSVTPSITFDNIKFWNDDIDYFFSEYNRGTGYEEMLNDLSITAENLKASYFYFKKK